MVSGTYVLTDSIDAGVRHDLHDDPYQDTDAVVTGKRRFDTSKSRTATPRTRRSTSRCSRRCKALPDVAAALGGVQGDAHLIGDDGKAIVFGGAPNLGFSVDRDRSRSSTR